MPTFEYLRISLAKQADLFDPGLSRQEFLRNIFSRRWDFSYRRRVYTYDPIPDSGDYIGGVIGREIAELRNDGPDTHWNVIEQRHWPIAYLSLDLAEREQIAAIQNHQRVGSPYGLLKSLLEHAVRSVEFASWKPSVEYISSASDFWIAANNYAGKITSLSFVFVPPNMLGAKEAIDDLVKAASEEALSEETELKLKNPHGNLVPSGSLVEASVSTATAGGGAITMRAGKKVIYSSSANRRTKEINSEDIPKPSSIEKVRDFFKRLMAK
ncbi:hypothetical protein BJ122_103145 [Rhodopseudomonas faecalis]|uniref:Uncharacterized protein n=1 Tax=Rhodopseudomonas faecalis TaxID=99655 RepID=A0A318TI15_9BRAD|nr:hypothetical protein [Rhodopseudomonas faecalis]PYF04491.1 hypothetical protein BJ122_103145 [Rhodopseudomonas faecalis]